MGIAFKNSQTKINLMKAFAGESQARNRYTIAAEESREQGMYAVREVFLFTAEQERAHAERFYELLESLSGETVDICGSFPIDKQDTLEGLLDAAQHNEYEEAEDVYLAFAKTAKEEGFFEVSSAFFQIAEIEKNHGDRFGELSKMLKSGTYFENEEGETWMCLNCGNIHSGKKLPGICPVCRREKGYFIPLEMAPYKTKELE